jgi:penicillin-binding protein 2
MGDKKGILFVMDVHEGDVLVLYSSPGYDPNLFSWGATPGEWQKVRTDPLRPMLNRIIGGQYPPASLFKVVPAVAGLASGYITSRATIFCSGSYQVGNRAFRCWNRWGHGRENLKEALRDSCDVFFYHYGLAMGVDLLAEWASRFGMGRPTGIDLTGDVLGSVAGREWKQRYRKEPWYPGDTANYSIGQGFLLITPVQIGVMYAALANGGYIVEPRVAFEKKPVSEDIHISGDILATLQEALVAVCKPGGTGFRAGQFGISVAGKTGTAEHDHGEDHAWFAGYAPAESPRYVAVTLVPGGGHGSSTAAPLAGEMLSYLCKGYLEDKEE